MDQNVARTNRNIFIAATIESPPPRALTQHAFRVVGGPFEDGEKIFFFSRGKVPASPRPRVGQNPLFSSRGSGALTEHLGNLVMWRFDSAPHGSYETRLVHSCRPTAAGFQRCDISQGLAPWVDPSGHAATKVSGTFGTVPPALSEKSAGRDSGPSSEERQGEYKRGFLGGD